MQVLPLPALLRADLQTVDRIVRERIQSQPVVAEMWGGLTVTSDGTRLRAALALLAAQCGSYAIERVQHVASTVELIHAAAQIHGGLVDQAARRRGAASLRDTWQQGVPLMTGDYMYALAAGEMALVPDPQAITYFSEAVKQISEAALTPVMLVAPQHEAEDQYLFVAGGQTAALFEAAALAGAAVSGCAEPQIAALGRFGRSLGLAWHIAADADNYGAAQGATNGAGIHTLRRRLITLPLIYAAAHDQRLASFIDDPHSEPTHMAWAVRLVQQHGVAPARAAAQRQRDDALAALAPFHTHPARQSLIDFALALVP